jgi:hypothetical protein
MDVPPDKLRTAAIVQLVVGIVDLTVGAWIAVFMWTCISGICTLGMCPIGGLLGIFIYPIGLFELIAGIVGLSNPRSGAQLMKIAGGLGLLGILFGSLSSSIGGLIVLLQLSSPEVKAYLEQKPI